MAQISRGTIFTALLSNQISRAIDAGHEPPRASGVAVTGAKCVVSANTLCYFGNLLEPLEAAQVCLRAQGLIAFTVESLADIDANRWCCARSATWMSQAIYASRAAPELIPPVEIAS
jgi:hypothetical protein